MLILQIWLTASLLLAAFWALAGLLIGSPRLAPRGGEAPSPENGLDGLPQGEAA